MHKSPERILDYCSDMSLAKVSNPLRKTLIFGFLAGVYIALAGLGAQTAAAGLRQAQPGFAKLAAAMVFPTGLVLVLLAGAELCTGNCLLYVGWRRGRFGIERYARNLGLVWLANLAGALFIVALTLLSASAGQGTLDAIQAAASAKASAGFGQIFLKGIGCNLLVCAAVWISYSTDSMAGKLLGMYLPILLFVLLDYDHIVANMFYLPMGLLSGASYGFGDLLRNFAAATLGNFVGGTFLVAGLYQLACGNGTGEGKKA